MSFRASLLLVFTTACSSTSGPSSPDSFSTDFSAFPAYCTGTLKKEQNVMKSIATGWQGDGTVRAPVGTKILVGADFQQWEGYVLLSDGKPGKLNADHSGGLTKDTDFTSDCAADTELQTGARQHFILLAPARLHRSKDLGGDACTLDRGLRLTNYSYRGGTLDASEISAQEIKDRCGFSPGFTKEIAYGMLVARP